MKSLSNYQISKECEKCINCNRCKASFSCPIGIVPQYAINDYKTNKLHMAQKYLSLFPFSELLGYICDGKCMKDCSRKEIDNSINIGILHSSILKDYPSKPLEPLLKSIQLYKKVAVFGAGLAGLTAVKILIENGFHVDLYEADNKLGGVLNYISPSKLPREVLNKELSAFRDSEYLSIFLNKKVINPVNVYYNQYNGIIIATGIEQYNDVDLEHYIHYIDFFESIYDGNITLKPEDKILIMGGGDMAADCALLANEKGCKNITLMYRGSISKMKMSRDNLNKLIDNNIDILPHTMPYSNASNTIYCSNREPEYFDYIIGAFGGKSTDKSNLMKEYPNVRYIGECQLGSSNAVDVVANAIKETRHLIRSFYNIETEEKEEEEF